MIYYSAQLFSYRLFADLTEAIWYFAFTAFACLTGIFPKMEAFTPEWTFQLTLNIVTLFVLVDLGLIFSLHRGFLERGGKREGDFGCHRQYQ
ncbi:transport protein [Salmonella enterica subsp. enterica]|nr:transport protein [Salmonella enterica subsp. enterica]EGO0678079.1 transport protein [Salmonella enterica]EEJ7379277.1 transport protein [Salmonella enterica subsp. enterica]EGO0733152.1 transport protein [Salmonella enterica]EGO0813888.1 transport protein [Salmonella enterica]